MVIYNYIIVTSIMMYMFFFIIFNYYVALLHLFWPVPVSGLSGVFFCSCEMP